MNMSEWISVEDRLPTHNHSVLGYAISGGLVGDSPMVDILSYLPDLKIWLQFAGYDDEVVKVSHWMPLPEPPTQE